VGYIVEGRKYLVMDSASPLGTPNIT